MNGEKRASVRATLLRTDDVVRTQIAAEPLLHI